MTDFIPKIELHVHIEGTITPEKCRDLAKKNNVVLAPGLFTEDGLKYQYSDFLDLVTRVYFGMAEAIKTKDDYEDIVYDYLARCAADKAIYVELIACPAQSVRSGISYKDMIDGIASGIDRARNDFDIESRINVTFERIFGGAPAVVAAQAERDADMILSYPHTYIVGLDIAGGEAEGDIQPFIKSFRRVQQDYPQRLGVRMHAGENAGPLNVRDAMDMGATRIGHGVQVIKDHKIQNMLLGDGGLTTSGVMLEIAMTCNALALKDFCPTLGDHPIRRLYDAGVPVCINTDDPGLIDTTIGREYKIAQDHFGFTDRELFNISWMAIGASFLPPIMKRNLYRKMEAFEQSFFPQPRVTGIRTGPAPT